MHQYQYQCCIFPRTHVDLSSTAVHEATILTVQYISLFIFVSIKKYRQIGYMHMGEYKLVA